MILVQVLLLGGHLGLIYFRHPVDRALSFVHLVSDLLVLDRIRDDLDCTVLLAPHHVLPNLVVFDLCEVRGPEAVVFGRERDGQR